MTACQTCGGPLPPKGAGRPRVHCLLCRPPRGEGIVGPKWEAVRAAVKARRAPCWLCHKPIHWHALPRTRWSFSVDHVIPRSKGGDPYDLANCKTAHYGCNSAKGNRTTWTRPHRPTPPTKISRW